MPFFKVCTTADIAPGEFKTFALLGKKVAVFNRDGEFYAISANCRHQGADLTKGRRDGDIFTCPRHGWQYNMHSGDCLSNGSLSLPKYPMKIEDGVIHVNPQDDPYAY